MPSLNSVSKAIAEVHIKYRSGIAEMCGRCLGIVDSPVPYGIVVFIEYRLYQNAPLTIQPANAIQATITPSTQLKGDIPQDKTFWNRQLASKKENLPSVLNEMKRP